MDVKRYSFTPSAVVTQKGASGYSVQCELGVTEYPLGNAGEYVLASDFDALKARLAEAEEFLRDASDVFTYYFDTEDGSEGQPLPNQAMKAVQYIDEYFAKYREVS